MIVAGRDGTARPLAAQPRAGCGGTLRYAHEVSSPEPVLLLGRFIFWEDVLEQGLAQLECVDQKAPRSRSWMLNS